MAAWALRLLAQAAQQLGHIDDALSLARSSTALIETVGDPEQSLFSNRVLAQTTWAAARYGEAETMHKLNITAARDMGREDHLAYSICGLGASQWPQGHLDAAALHLDDALARARRLDDQFLMLSAEYHLANLWGDRAYVAPRDDKVGVSSARREAETRFNQVITLARMQGNHAMLIFGAVDLATFLIQWNRPADAQPLITLARRTLHETTENVGARGWTLLAEAGFAFASGQADMSLAKLQEAIPLLDVSSPAGLAQAHRLAGEAHAQRGERSAATVQWDVALGAALAANQELEVRRIAEVRT